MNADEAVAKMIRLGVLVPIAVFGTDCDHDGCEDERHGSFGLMDRFSRHSPAGSDCNRAEFYMLRPSDDLMQGPLVKEALDEVIAEGEALYE